MELRNYKTSDLPHLLELSSQFDTSPFTFDNRLFDPVSGLDPVFAREMISRKETYTFVLESEQEIIGYISISMNVPLSRVLKRNIASILLLVVHKNHRSKGMGKYLVSKAIEVMRNKDIALFTVGTDLYNTPAINSYERNEFLTRMTWHIYRWHPGKEKKLSLSENVDIIKESHLHYYRPWFDRPISLLHEPEIEHDTLMEFLWNTFLSKRHSYTYPILEYFKNENERALILVNQDTLSMQSLRTDNNIYRISDLLIPDNAKYRDTGISVLNDIKCRFSDGHYLEIWVKSTDKQKIHLLEESGFQLSYSGINLHRIIRN